MAILSNINKIYGSNKRTSKKDNGNIQRFLKKVGNNRVLDLYLKYLGITMLTTNTLVPLALILGAKTFHNVVNDMISKDKKGGAILDNKLPILDDAAIGTYLKITGLTAIPLSPYTLVPLGVLMVLYDRVNKSGGGKNRNSNNIIYDINTRTIQFGNVQGGGSDFKSTLYSRGAGNNNLVTPKIHGMFNKSAPFIANQDLKIGAYYDNVPNKIIHNPIATTDTPFPLAADMYGGKRRRRYKKKLTKSKKRRLNKKRGSKKRSKKRSRRSRRRN